ncbi:duplicated ATPase component MtsB of energizing module of methionine-regulated ECF transporter [Tetragenococcus muriaticus PMC-11-5]|uniref:Duplicated ATPase component MtsB of energizing module of methionine-regulated ECF transporter n=1 Tax=Tetragenococcus muriaticus PMC-11-5 TaxID=1302649 RepID=A0A091BWB0_9ENTE|nr:duplicated ATPase component MtsB of energizing module of methionine-regulated ECF transporter [Tetragenococcus muriaticus PMC-11-5]
MAGVLINESPILLFDEPLANLDPATGKEAIGLIDEIHKSSQTTVIIIEHRLEDALAKPVDRIIVFNDGKIVADQTPDALLRTDLLAANGIREPLYLTAMKYAGVDSSRLSYLNELSPAIKQKVIDWQAGLPEKNNHTSRPPIFTMDQVSFKYRKQDPYILNHLSLTLHQGEKVSVVGKNGAGKSTLFKAICGFIQPSGQMKWGNQSLDHETIKERADKIGYVMQNPNQMISQKMIYDEVALGLVLRGEEPEQIKEKVFHVLKICGLYPFRNWPIAALSYGQKSV